MIRVRVPATTANLGPGFDCMGMALDLWNTFTVEETGPRGEVVVENTGEGADRLPTDRTNLVAETTLALLGKRYDDLKRGLKFTSHAEVPCGSGLGSSSTAVVAGVTFAEALLGDIDRDRILRRSVQIEGHGDNVGPAIVGGLLLIMPHDGGVVVRSVLTEPMRVVVCVPDFDFPTSVARAALPQEVPLKDAIFNLGRAMFALQAFRNGDDDLLSIALEDRIHQPYRLGHIPGAADAIEAARQQGAVGSCLSGAGPGIIAFARKDHGLIGQAMVEAYAQAGLQARAWVLDTTQEGVSFERSVSVTS
ncbi:MAG: homoserine kinase [Fimbriimonadaceae bacterium]|nr:homoserine kinase [Fimbriimonadaceae bacterium]